MSYEWGLRNLLQPVRHRVFVSYHHAGDQQYYDAFSRASHDTHEVVYDNSLERMIDSGDINYVIRRIRENHVAGTSCTIVLVGAQTWGRKYVDWEIQATLDKEHGLIGVQLPTAPRNAGNKIVVPDRLHDNIESGFALWLSWEKLTTSAEQLERYVADAKSRNPALINNARDRRMRNA
jgi:hypothetical protein